MPEVPRPYSLRGRMLARQRKDDAAGRFPDRIFAFNFTPIAAGASQTLTLPVTSMGGRHVRLLALQARVFLPDGGSPLGNELSKTRLLLQINGQENFVSGNADNTVSLAMLVGRDQQSSWYWWRAAPRMRAGDILRVTLFNTLPGGEGSVRVQPQFAVRMIDDALWARLFAHDAAAAGWS